MSENQNLPGEIDSARVICRHIVAAMLREGDERMLFRVGEIVRALRESNKEKERELSKATAA